jgi:hypothetical protein
MPEVFSAASPVAISAGQTLSAVNVHVLGAAFERYSVKFFVVPDSSAR